MWDLPRSSKNCYLPHWQVDSTIEPAGKTYLTFDYSFPLHSQKKCHYQGNQCFSSYEKMQESGLIKSSPKIMYLACCIRIPDHKVTHSWCPPRTPSRGCWSSCSGCDLIFIEAHGKCQFSDDTDPSGSYIWLWFGRFSQLFSHLVLGMLIPEFGEYFYWQITQWAIPGPFHKQYPEFSVLPIFIELSWFRKVFFLISSSLI